MAECKEHTPGTFCWVDLGTTDAGAAKKFYSELMGWEPVDTPAGPDMVYTMLQLGGKAVAALYKMSAEQCSHGIPPHWLSYVAVANADETAEKVRSLGGTLIMEPFDVFEYGRTFAFTDPTGAALAAWQPKQHIGALLKNQSGTLCWNELMTDNEQKASEFYRKLFGWSTRTQEMGGGSPYTIFTLGDQPAGGMMKIQEEWDDVPPNWMVYFAVQDCDVSAEKVKSLGGEIIVPPTDAPDAGRFAVIQDPQSAVFGIIRLSNPQ